MVGKKYTCGIIVSCTYDNVIGLHGKIPWNYSEDIQHFKHTTTDSTIIMGRITWESLPKKPLLGRRNIVITSHPIDGVECFCNIPSSLSSISTSKVWFIGGSKIYQEALQLCDVIDITYVPDIINHSCSNYFPSIYLSEWEIKKTTYIKIKQNLDGLINIVYERKIFESK